MLDHACQVGRAPLIDRGHDLYETPAVAVHALLRVEVLPHRLWEPACGHGKIVNVLRAAGHEVLASDLVDYGDPTHFYGRDFLSEHRAPDGCEAIVTNPPFKLAEQFVAHALKLCPRVVMLLRLAFFESRRRSAILENCGLARIHAFRKRLPMMHRAGWEGRKANSGMAFAWYAWDRAHVGPTEIRRISWEEAPPASTGGPAVKDDHLTEPNPTLAALVARTVPGMAHWAGTGPKGTTCGDCRHYVEVQWGRGKSPRCEMFHRLMRETWGPKPLPAQTPSCRHYQRGAA